MHSTIRFSLSLAVAWVSLPSAASAQISDARWQPWIGCWEPVLQNGSPARPLGAAPRVCIAPAAGRSAVEVTTINAGKVTSRDLIEATAEPRAVTRDGCRGTETAQWSATGPRVYMRSALTCADGTKRTSSGVLSFTANNQWLDVRGLSLNGGPSGIAVGRFVAVNAADSAGIPANVWRATPTRTAVAEAVSVAAAAPLTLTDIADVATVLQADVASAWLVERTRGLLLSIDGKQLAALADNGVPASVIDVAVALAYPDVFGIANDSRAAQRRVDNRALTSQGQYRGGYLDRPMYGAYDDPYLWALDPWYYYSMYGGRYGYRYPYYGYGYSFPYGYGYGYPYGGYGRFGGGYYTGPAVIVIRNGDANSSPPSHGRVVKGQGYTSGAGANGPVARGGGSSSGTSGSASMSAGGSSSSSSSAGSSSSSGGGRTAVKKP
jgi:hypothetical protein